MVTRGRSLTKWMVFLMSFWIHLFAYYNSFDRDVISHCQNKQGKRQTRPVQIWIALAKQHSAVDIDVCASHEGAVITCQE